MGVFKTNEELHNVCSSILLYISYYLSFPTYLFILKGALASAPRQSDDEIKELRESILSLKDELKKNCGGLYKEIGPIRK
jgi:hypothetical protein